MDDEKERPVKKNTKTDNEQVHKDELHSSHSANNISQAALSDSKSGPRFALPDCQVFVHDIQSYHPTDLSSSTDGDTQGWTPADQVQDSTIELWQLGHITNSNSDFSTKRENINRLGL
ncbi:hypothetical protein V1522DRAFT_411942 [Lipomyces starkeyi]